MTTVQTQWDLASTSDSLVSVAKGLLQAATSDNVQPLAILACERFGNTIAMSQETCYKMETVVLHTPKPAAVKFLRAAVGYSAGDCATQLGKSLAGVQFLGLAAAMVTTMGSFASGTALQRMLKSSVADKTLLPTVKQLKDLLASLENRCQLSGFVDSVIGWQMLLSQIESVKDDDYKNWTRGSQHPPLKGVEDLVDVFRQLFRLGESSVVKATVKTQHCVPCIVAFTKWCLGIPPSVFLENGTPVLEQLGSRVTVIACPDKSKTETFEIGIQHTISRLDELLVSDGGQKWAGMASIDKYWQWRLRQLNLDSGFVLSVLEQVLPYAITQVVNNPMHSYGFGRTEFADETGDFIGMRFIPFQDDHAITTMLSSMLSKKTILGLRQLEDGMCIEDLPLMKLYLAELRSSSSCSSCAQSAHDGRISSSCRTCPPRMFFEYISMLIADILSLSLFQLPERLLVQVCDPRTMHQHWSAPDTFQSCISILIRTNSFYKTLSPSTILRWTLQLIGHTKSNTLEYPTTWVMSCHKGQAVYPTICDTQCVEKRAYMSLTWISGQLEYNSERYSIVTGGSTSGVPRYDFIAESAKGKPVTKPSNLATTLKTQWNVEVADGFLYAGFHLQDPSNQTAIDKSYWRCPMMTFIALGSCLILESCRHDLDAKLKTADSSCAYVGPEQLPPNFPSFGLPKISGNIKLVAVDGAEDLRLYAISYTSGPFRYALLRKRACLECCLKVARMAGIEEIIL
jgi:hypothetical protein